PVELLKINGLTLEKGTVIRSHTGGGGGYGPAEERDPQAVCEDVRDGYVTADHAREAYRVVIDAAGQVDEVATAALRSA
ncbi:MAG: hydantoinase B/oxoprolinase family protein, partial [Pseudomonadota bacterium]